MLDDAEWLAASGLVDEWCGSRGNSLILAEGTAEGGVDVVFRRFCFRSQRHAEREREYFEAYHALDERLPRLRRLPDGRVTPNSLLFTAEEEKTSAVFNEVMSRNGTRNGLDVRLDGPDGSRIVWATADSAQGDGGRASTAASATVRTARQTLVDARARVDPGRRADIEPGRDRMPITGPVYGSGKESECDGMDMPSVGWRSWCWWTSSLRRRRRGRCRISGSTSLTTGPRGTAAMCCEPGSFPPCQAHRQAVIPCWSWSLGRTRGALKAASTRTGAAPSSFYTVQAVDAAAADEVRMARVTLGAVEVDLSGFTTTGYAVDGNSLGRPPVIDGIGLSSFFVPADGVYRPGDEIYWFARFHKAVTVNGAPVLTQRIGDEMREARYRPDVRVLAGGIIFTYTVQDGDCDMDGIGIPANAISGGAIREADGSRSADTSHPAQDPSRDLQAGATRPVACAAVPVAPALGLLLLASLLLAAGAHLVRQRRLA